jgi:ABC-type uncharacterized transport system permease subunit
MQKALLWLIIVVLVLIALVLYRSRSGSHLDVTPETERAIDKAKRR